MPPHFEELEPRVLYSADLAPQAETPPVETVEHVVEDQAEPDSQTSLTEDEILYLDESGNPTNTSTQSTETTQRLEVVFIDSSISEYQTLLDGLQSSSDTQIQHFLLDRNVDGFEQLQFALESLENISAIHLISHGDDASFQLGQDSINSDNANNYQASFSSLTEKLKPDADLLIYGCNIAETTDGQQLLDKLSEWTGADVAGSTDLTGHNSLGGDWELEYQQGHIETSVVVSSASQLSWNYALDTVSGLVGHWTLDSNANDSTTNAYNGTLTGNAATDTATPTNQIGAGKLTLDGSGDYVDLSAHSGGISSLSSGTVSLWVNFTANGLMTAFNVSDTGSGDNYAVLGFDNGTPYFKVKDTATLLEVDAVNSINDGNWHHVAITVDGSGNKLYVDGVQATGGNLNYATGNASTSAFFGDVSSVDAMQIGINEYNSGFSWDFNGLIDDVRVFNRALSASDIGELVAAATPLHSIEVSTTSDVSDGDTSSLAALNAYKGADGEISLREAIEAANNTANIDGSTPDEIHFNISDSLVNSAHTISLTVALPDITDAVIINGTTDPDFGSSPVIQIDDGGAVAHGLKVTGDGSTIKSLAVTGFNEGGITLNGDNNLVVGNYVGLNPDGSLDGNSQKHGILVGGSNNIIGGTTAADRNYIVDHTYAGITLNGGSADHNHVMGNYIGVMPDGSTLAANTNFSIYTANGSQNNIIGTNGDGIDDANEGNVIAGSNLNFGGSGASGTIIAGNKIGTDATGTVRLGGTVTVNGDSNARIGTDNDGTSDALEANIIATKITVSSNASVAVIAGNYIGVQSDGTTSFGSSNGGIIVNSDATVTVGGTSTAEANVIAHNGGDGVQINSTGATVSVLGNSIFGNTGSGIDIVNDGPNQNDPEDADAGTNDLLNFPVLTNVVQNGANLDIDFVVDLPAGNYRIEFFDNPAGLDSSGYGEGQQYIGFVNITVTGALGNESFSTTLNSVTASDVTNITTTATESDGFFATFGATSEFGPQFDGQQVITVTTTSDVSDGDTSSITALLGNRGADGEISLREAMEAADNTVNINASTPDQIHFDIATTDGNYAAGTNSWLIQLGSMLPHIDDEVVIDATTQVGYDGTPSIELDGSLIGGGSDSGFITDADELVIRGLAINNFSGYGIHLSGFSGHLIESNYIGTDITGTVAAGNGVGIYVGAGADNTTIGSSGNGNLISGNTAEGIYVTGSTFVDIKSNIIGTDITGALDLGNGSSGIRLHSADGNTIGGTTATERNLISGNDARGIYISDSDNNTVQGNFIGTNAAGSAAIGNVNAGVRISGISTGNTIGGTAAGSYNVISGNADGIYIQDLGTTGNIIQGNYIGTDATGLLDVGNLDRGIQLENNTSANTIGGTTAAERNIISGNDTDGIIISNGATDNLIQGNYIGLGVDGSTAVGNGNNGVRITTPDDNLIGGTVAGAGNVIANSGGDGINISTGVDNSILGNTIYNSAGEAIDLGNNAVTSNDANDVDTGPNNYQNYPDITKAELSGTDLTLDGTLDTDRANTQYRIEFFGIESGSADATNGEARYYLGSTTITTDGVADGSFTGVILSGVTLAIGDVVSATATKIDAPAMVGVNDLLAYGNSSEISTNFTITEVNVAPTDITPNSFNVDEFTDTSGGYSLGTLSSTDANAGNTFTYTLIGGPDQAKFSIGGAGSDELILTDGVLDVDTQASYSVTVRTTDQGGLFYSESITVNVNNVNEAPVINGSDTPWINELHYDNSGTDSGEAVEIAGAAGTDLTGWSLEFYNGGDGTVYRTEALAGSLADQGGGFGTLVVNLPVNGIQNDMEAIALVDDLGTVVEFISYEGSFTATNGAASGLTSTDIGVAESGTTPVGHSLQRTGSAPYSWATEAANTLGSLNTGQTYTSGPPTTATVAEDVTVFFGTTTGNAITINDPDAGANTLQVTLDASDGTLTLASTAGLTSAVGDGTNSVTIEGTLANLNNALDGLGYQGTLNFNGADTLNIGVDDQGNTGSGGALTDSANIAITVTAVNDEESLDTNAGLTLNEGATATVTSAMLSTSDAENAASSVIYTVDATPVNGNLKLNGTTLSNSDTFTQDDIDNNRLTYEHFGTETTTDSFDFSVDDAAGTSTSATFNISITLVNENAPVITPAQSFSVSELAANGFSLGNAVAIDVDTGASLSGWTITGGNTGSVFAIDAATGEITVADNSSLDFDVTPSYSLSLTVSDGTNTSAVETVTITVSDVSTAITAAQSFSIAENVNNSDAVGSVVTTGDEPKTFSITAGNIGSAFAIDNSGNITVADASAIDYETLNSYSLTIQASDGTTPVSETVTVTITDINENGVGAVSDSNGSANSVAENASIGTTVGLTAFADDPDGSDTVTYSLSDDASGRFTIDSNTGVVTVNAALNAETATSHSITILATSTDTSSSSQSFSITVTDVDEFDVGAVSDSDVAIDTVAENAGIGTAVGITALATDTDVSDNITYSLSDDAGGLFSINSSTGIVTVAAALDYETATSHNITVLATSDDGSTSNRVFSIAVTDVNEKGVGAISDTDTATNAVDENSAPGSNVGITAEATDLDGADTVSYSLSDDAGGLFSIDASTGIVTVIGALDAESSTTQNITVVATSSDGSTQSRTFAIAINDLDEFDVGPVSDANAAGNTVAENAAIGTAVGITALANDADVNDNVTYSLSDDAGGRFAIDPNSGVITVAAALDYEITNTHNITVVATSDDGSSSSLATTILVTDVNDIAPSLNSATVSIAEDTSETPALHNFNDLISGNDADAEGETLNYTLIAGNDDGLFALNAATGVVTLVNSAALDYESSSSYILDIQASDGMLSTTAQLTIQITNVNEAPVIHAPAGLLTDEDTGLSITNLSVTDPDAGNAELEITLTSSNGFMSLGDQSALSSVPVGDNLDQFTLRGSTAALNQALSGLSFTPDSDFNGTASISVVANDLGNTGSGTALSDSETLSITVIPVNDEPLLDVPDNVEITPGEAIEFTTALDNLAPLQDLDSENSTHNLSLRIDNASLSISDETLKTLITQESAHQLSAAGDLSTINRLLNALVITPETGFSGELTLDISLEDEGSVLVGGSRSISTQVHFYVPEPVIPGDDSKNSDSSSDSSSDKQSESDQLVLIEFESTAARHKPANQDTDESPIAAPALEQDFYLGAQGSETEPRKPLAEIFHNDDQNQQLLTSKTIRLKTTTNSSTDMDLELNELDSQNFSPSLQGFINGLQGDTENTEVSLGVRLAEISGAGIVVGSVVWLLKSSSLLSSLLVSYPAWRGMDPLPVLLPKSPEQNARVSPRTAITEKAKNKKFALIEVEKQRL